MPNPLRNSLKTHKLFEYNQRIERLQAKIEELYNVIKCPKLVLRPLDKGGYYYRRATAYNR